MLAAETLSISIACAYPRAAAYLSEPAKFPEWAAGLSSSMRPEDDHWVAETAGGPVHVRFTPANAFGVLDHWVTINPGAAAVEWVEVYVPMRVVPNREGVEVMLTLYRQPTMSDAEYARDLELVRADLRALKAILERTK